MTVTRISTYNLHQNTLNNAASTQNQLFTLQNQISSGLKTNNFSDLDGQVEQFTQLDNKIRRTEAFVQNNNMTSSRLQTMSNAVDQVVDVVADLRSVMLLRRNETLADSIGFDQQIDAAWRAVSAQLNISLEGRHLFGGTRTDVPPVNMDSFPELAVEGVPDDGYYQGGLQNTTFRVQDNYEVEQNIRADNDAFQKLYAVFAIAADAHAADDEVMIEKAAQLLQDTTAEILDVKVKLEANRVNVDTATARLDTLKLYWKSTRESLVNTDLVSASTEVAVQQGILQASFQVFARINQLQLSDFLR